MDLIFFSEELSVFIFEVWCEYALANVVGNLLWCPESSAAKFVFTGLHFSVIYAAMNEDEFLFALALKDIVTHTDGLEVGDA